MEKEKPESIRQQRQLLPDHKRSNPDEEDLSVYVKERRLSGIILLDEHGKEFRSVEFANWIERKMHTVNKRLVFIIGGPYGFAPKIYDVTQEKISLSKMTFSHQMIRLIFVEQLYRAMTILNNGPYHHE